jgi:hypothetical protein
MRKRRRVEGKLGVEETMRKGCRTEGIIGDEERRG